MNPTPTTATVPPSSPPPQNIGGYKGVPITAGSDADIQAQIAKIDAAQKPAPTPPVSNTPPAGMDAKTYANFKAANPNIEPTAEDVDRSNSADKLNTAQGNIDTLTQQSQDAYKQFSQTAQSFTNGSIPLTPDQQAQVEGLKQQYGQLIQNQQLANKTATGLGNIRGFQTGSAEYDPSFQTKVIGSIFTAGQNKVADLNTKMASAVGQMTSAFQSSNFAQVKDAYDEYTKFAAEQKATFDKTIADVTAHMKDVQDAADKQQAYELDVAKFNQTKDQNSFDNAFKAEQEAFAEKKDAATLSETSRHNRATEALDAFKAGEGAGGGNNLGVNSAQMSSTGGVDPVSQKQVLDQITAQYGPMTATQIKSLADYTMNPTDWKAGATKGMSRDQAVGLAKSYDPTYDDKMFATRSAYLKNLTSGTMAQGVLSANKSINHLIAFADTVKSLDNNNTSNFANSISNSVYKVFDTKLQSNYSQAQTEANGLKDELAKFFKGTGSSDVKSIDDWSKNLDVNATPGNLHGTVQGAINLLAGQLDVMNQQYQSTMGKAPDTTILQPATVQKLSQLKNQGFQVDIPGVLYTDPQAYVKNDPSGADNLKAVVSKYPNLSQADALQLAQSL